MGAFLSYLAEVANGSTNDPGLGDIPESCVACVFLYLTPPQICNLARLNRAFRGAASSDSVWQSKLPSNYQDLLDLLPPQRYQNLSKKDIYALLSRPVPFDDGNKEVWLDRITGKICMSISAKAMSITGIDDRRYWNWISTEESRGGLHFDGRCIYASMDGRFNVVAYLQQIWWFEVDGMVKFPFPADIYTLTFRLHLGRFYKRLGRRGCSFEHTHGWDVKPVRFEMSTSDGQQATHEFCLDENRFIDVSEHHKRGCWIEYKVGEFFVNESVSTTEIRFSMKQIDCTHSKGGVCVDSVFIVPSNLKERKT